MIKDLFLYISAALIIILRRLSRLVFLRDVHPWAYNLKSRWQFHSHPEIILLLFDTLHPWFFFHFSIDTSSQSGGRNGADDDDAETKKNEVIFFFFQSWIEYKERFVWQHEESEIIGKLPFVFLYTSCLESYERLR